MLHLPRSNRPCADQDGAALPTAFGGGQRFALPWGLFIQLERFQSKVSQTSLGHIWGKGGMWDWPNLTHSGQSGLIWLIVTIPI